MIKNMKRTPMDRFLDFIELDNSGCWNWIGVIYNGRCIMWLDGHNINAKEFIVPKSDTDTYAHSSCGNVACVNPDHIEFIPKKSIVRYKNPVPAIERFWSHTSRADNGCIEWTGAISRGGYGVFRDNKKNTVCHRWLYEYTYGPIDRKLECDHLCRNRKCVNLDHIEIVTKLVNVQRGESGKWQRDKTHCAKGHPYDSENTLWYPHKHRNGTTYMTRHCKQCIADRRHAPDAREYHKKYVKEWNKLHRQKSVRNSGTTPI